MSAHRTPEEIRKHLKHPVIDGDGHWVEYAPVFGERIRKAVGNLGADGFLESQRRVPNSLRLTPAERAQRGVGMEGFWNRQATNTLDRATAMMPKMLYERLDEIGSDFAVIYPTAGLRLPRIKDDETRRAVIRALQHRHGRLLPRSRGPHDAGGDHPDAHAGRGDRGARVRHEAARRQGRHVRQRHVAPDAGGDEQRSRASPLSPWGTTCSASTARTTTTRCGRSAASSAWRRRSTAARAARACAIARATSSTTISAISRRPATRSPRRIFLGGVTRRFPELHFAFLEGGVGWGCQLFGDLIEHWERRGARASKRMDPDKLDRKLLLEPRRASTATTTSPRSLTRRDGWPDPGAKTR